MIYKAYSLDTEKLLSLPETGMGYQVIEANEPMKVLGSLLSTMENLLLI